MKICKDREQMLIKEALLARQKAYTPYSNYKVGAALLTQEGKIFTGCNVESASYGATNCAERTAIFKAVSEGYTDFSAIAIVGAEESTDNTDRFPDFAFPCGVCRQVMKEFCRDDFEIIVAKSAEEYKKFTLVELLPYGFGGTK